MTTTAVASTSPATSTVPLLAAARFVLDAAHSQVSFAVRHMMIANVRGGFERLSGELTYDPLRPEATTMSVSIDAGSISTREEKRDAHLRSADFFDVEQHPTITFVSTSARRRGDGLDVTGQLTIRGTSREVTLAIDEITGEHTDPWANRRLGASARTTIRRSDFGMTWNAALEAGGILVGDEVKIHIEAELIKQK